MVHAKMAELKKGRMEKMLKITTRLASDLTDEEQEKFIEVFYEEIGVYDLNENFEADDALGTPWSCPWYNDRGEVLVGFTIEECAKNYCDKWRDYIRELIDGDIKRAEEEGED